MAKEAADKTKNWVANEQADIANLAGDIKNLLGDGSTGGSSSGSEESTSTGSEPPTEIATGETIEKYIDKNEQFTVEVKDSGKEINLSFQNEDNGVVSIEKNIVTGLKVGDAMLIATWNDSDTATINVHVYDPETIGAPKRINDYGKIVKKSSTNENYTAGEVNTWRLFYQDKDYTYIISDTLVSLPESTLEESYTAGGYGSKTGEDVSTIGKKLNSQFTNFTSSNTNGNIKAVGWLTDETKWQKYAIGEGALYAIGSPTAELFAASYNTVQKDHELTLTKGQCGYLNNSSSGWFEKGKFGGIYNKIGGDYWWCLASPGDGNNLVLSVHERQGYCGEGDVIYAKKVRPLVCFRTSEFNSAYTLID